MKTVITGLIVAFAMIIGTGSAFAAPTPPNTPNPPDQALDIQERIDKAIKKAQKNPPQNLKELQELLDSVVAPPKKPSPKKPKKPKAPQTPCPATAKACIDLGKQQTWLQDKGLRSYGPVPITSGKPGWETPRGTHHVNRKVRHAVSRQFNNAPMPYSVYFTNNGIAFHEGSLTVASHGCIHLSQQAAAVYFDRLNVGDIVFVF